MIAHALSFVLAVSSAAPAPNRVLLMPLTPGEGVTPATADAVTDTVAGELRHIPGLQVLTRKEMTAVISVERQKQLMGCQSESCMAEIGGALDADRLITGTVTKLGESWILHLQLVDAKKVATLASADRRKKGGSIDDVLDAIPGMVKELYSGQPTPPPSAGPAPVAEAPAPKPTESKKALSPRWAEIPYDGVDASKLSLATDGKGHYMAFDPHGDSNTPLFSSSDGQRFFAQRVFGWGSDADSFEYNFWEPRSNRNGASFEMKKGVYELECGKKDHSRVKLTAVPEAEARKIFAKAKLLKSRWQRQGIAIARDDEGTYYYVDQAREPDDNTDFQLYIGESGSLVPVETRVVANDRDGSIFGTPDGKLRISEHEAEWIQNGGARRKLKLIELDRRAAMQVYGSLGVYKGEQFGTPCDWAQ